MLRRRTRILTTLCSDNAQQLEHLVLFHCKSFPYAVIYQAPHLRGGSKMSYYYHLSQSRGKPMRIAFNQQPVNGSGVH